VVLVAALCGLVVALAAIYLVVQQRRALEHVAQVLTNPAQIEFSQSLALVGRATRAPSYIPPTDEVVWRHKMRTVRIGNTVLHRRARRELELSL
jgi:hypothetical protein